MRRAEHRAGPDEEVAGSLEHAAHRRLKAQVRLLLLIAATLALVCLGLAHAWRTAREEALCWRAFVNDGERPPEGDCERLR